MHFEVLSGFSGVSNQEYSKFLKAMGSKSIADTKNIYGTEILELTNDIIHENKVVGKLITCGLHIHFGSFEEASRVVSPDFKYKKVSLPVYDPHSDVKFSFIELYKRELASEKDKQTISCAVNRITPPVIKYFVERLDKEVLPKYTAVTQEYTYGENSVNIRLSGAKYRNSGFYETKDWGFEYRSLPFTQDSYSNMWDIINFSFDLLKELG